jgi:8-oxo-dGTP pyrophosphatase MutT (NUDIX family)
MSLPRLSPGNASAALIVLENGSYLLQLRDDKPEIWYPGHWGCFGGAADAGEDPAETLRRELREELDLVIDEAQWFTRFAFDLRGIGSVECTRDYYVVPIAAAALARCRLGEGAAFRAFPAEVALGQLKLVPYDSFALFLHSQQRRIG